MSETRVETGRRAITVVSAEVAAGTDIGLRRETNEDAYLVAGAGDVLAVADGLGGLPAGEVASELAIKTVAAQLDVDACADKDAARGHLARVFRAAKEAVERDAELCPAHRGMATTLVVGVVRDRKLFVSHVGDVRAYVMSQGEPLRLTDDHTRAWAMVEQGLLTVGELPAHPARNALTRVLGLGSSCEPSFAAWRLESDDVILLCSDGLWEPLGESRIAAIATGAGDAGSRVAALLDAAIVCGAPDNVTVALRRVV